MNWTDNITCCHVAIALTFISGIETALFLGYTVKIGKQQIVLKNQEKEHQLRIKKLEKKNGKEQREIDELKKEIQKLKKSIK